MCILVYPLYLLHTHTHTGTRLMWLLRAITISLHLINYCTRECVNNCLHRTETCSSSHYYYCLQSCHYVQHKVSCNYVVICACAFYFILCYKLTFLIFTVGKSCNLSLVRHFIVIFTMQTAAVEPPTAPVPTPIPGPPGEKGQKGEAVRYII